jgi:hypothetical protein
MRYTLITGSGRVMRFYIESVAQCYQQCFGGAVFDHTVLDTKQEIYCV